MPKTIGNRKGDCVCEVVRGDKHNLRKPTICNAQISVIHSANKHAVQICRCSRSPAADGLADGSGERPTSPVNGIERSLSPAVVPKTKSLPVSATTSPTALFVHRAGTLAKGYPLSKLLSEAEPLPFEKEININLVYSSCLKHASSKCCWVIPGRLTSERKACTSPSSFINHSTLLLERSSAKLLVFSRLFMHSSTRQAQNASTRRFYAPSR